MRGAEHVKGASESGWTGRTWLIVATLATAACNGDATERPPLLPAAPDADARCAVWEREMGFARSVEEHDSVAFKEHVQTGALFITGGEDLRGRDAITLDWKTVLEGKKLQLHWYPTSIVVLGDPRVALARGPYWFDTTDDAGKPKYLKGGFQGVWVKDNDGVWRVIVEGGTPGASAATEAEVKTLAAAAPARCPF